MATWRPELGELRGHNGAFSFLGSDGAVLLWLHLLSLQDAWEGGQMRQGGESACSHHTLLEHLLCAGPELGLWGPWPAGAPWRGLMVVKGTAEPWFSTEGDCATQGPFGNIWGHLGLL